MYFKMKKKRNVSVKREKVHNKFPPCQPFLTLSDHDISNEIVYKMILATISLIKIFQCGIVKVCLIDVIKTPVIIWIVKYIYIA